MATALNIKGSTAEASLSRWASLLVFLAICAWAAAGEGSGRYAIYALPPALIALSVLLYNGRPWIDRGSVIGLQLYGLVAALALATNGYLGEFGMRDLLIIGGYLCLYSLSFKAPQWVADFVLVTLAAGMVIENLGREVNTEIQLVESEGMLESTFAFPLGALLIYFILTRKWLRVLITFVIFFAAFKRIAIMAVIAALAVYVFVRMFRMVRLEKAIVVAIMLACSVVALHTLEIFTFMAREVGGTNATGVSLGRFGFAAALWEEWERASVPQMLFGRGPGEADAIVMRMSGYNPHNDWLKILTDYGAFGLVAFYVILLKVFGKDPFRLCLLTYVSILMVTANTFIYMHFHAAIFLPAMIPSEDRQKRRPLARSVERRS